MIEVNKIDQFRSKPFVNMTDDMVRVELVMTKNDWYELKKKIDNENDM